MDEYHNNIKGQRNAGVELLRMFAALGVVFGHFINASQCGGGVIISNLRVFTIPSVDVFVIISGYFLCLNNKRTIGKVSSLVFQTVFVFIFLVLAKYGLNQMDVDFKAVIPVKWFIPLYVTLYCISPLINSALNHLNPKQLTYLIIMLLLFFSVIPMINGVATAAGHHLGFSTISTVGNNAGYNIVNFVVLYCVGAYIRLGEIHNKISMLKVVGAIILSFIAIKLLGLIPLTFTPYSITGWYDNIFVILLAAFFLILSLKVKINGKIAKVIVDLAKANFICYLIHYPFIGIANPQTVLTMPTYKALPIIIMFCMMVYVVAFLVWSLYKTMFGWFTKRLDNIVFYSDSEK